MDTKVIRTIIFNILVILTILFIYFLFFPKKSYIKEKLDDTLNPAVEESFNQNINAIKIVALKYFGENDGRVFLQTFIDDNLLLELKDSNNIACDTSKSYSEKKDDKLTIYLKCNDKEKIVEKKIDMVKENGDQQSNENKEKLFCLYQYEKKIQEGYTEYGEWSNWQLEEILSDEFTNVETKIEQELDGTKTVTESREVSIDANRNLKIVCPEGYIEENSKCKQKTESNSITASIKYTCPSGYTRNGTMCYGSEEVSAEKKYYCPTNQTNIEFVLSGSSCKVYNVRYADPLSTQVNYTCPNGYKQSNNKCSKTEYYETEVDNYKEVTYYRYQKREAQSEKKVIKWSRPNDNNLLNDEYNMTIEILCEF